MTSFLGKDYVDQSELNKKIGTLRDIWQKRLDAGTINDITKNAYPELLEDTPKEEPKPEKPKDRPSGKNYRIEARIAMLNGRIKAEVEFVKQVKAKGELRPERIKELEDSIDKIRERVLRVEKDDKKLNLPHIPMGKNTHTKSKEGYVFNKTNIKVQPTVKNDLVTNMLQERIKGMWNSLPDHTRDLVKNLVIKKSIAKGRKWQGGRWDGETGTVFINIHPRTSDNLDHNFFHEIGHARWHDLNRTNPEKIKKFRETQKEIGSSPTAYARSYLMVKERNDDREANYRRKMAKGGFAIPQKAEKILANNRVGAEDLYHNEIHSELNAYAMGVLSTSLITAPKAKMEKLLKAYKEMWDLE